MNFFVIASGLFGIVGYELVYNPTLVPVWMTVLACGVFFQHAALAATITVTNADEAGAGWRDLKKPLRL